MALPPSIKPLCRRHDHRIFARHLIGEGGHAEALLHPERNSRGASLFGRVHLIDARDFTPA